MENKTKSTANREVVDRKLSFYTRLLKKMISRRRDYSKTAIREIISTTRFYQSL